MGIIFSDRFNRVGGTLGAGWTEQSGGLSPSLSTNMSTTGDFAVLDASGFAVATADSTNGSSHWVQCWCRPDSSPVAVAGIVLRFIDVNHFYYLVCNPTNTRLELRRRTVSGGVIVTSLRAQGPSTSGQANNNWNLVSVLHTGNRFRVFLNGNYNASADGADIDFTDSDGNQLTGSGLVGIVSSANSGSGLGLSGPQWNDFTVFDGARDDTIYVTSTGTNGYGVGDAAAPMPGLGHGLNSAGTVAGTRLKFVDAGPYTNSGASSSEFTIGHADKFNIPGFTYPTYSDDTGEVLDRGMPNLIIEGADGATRTVMRENTGLNAFFRIDNGCAGVVFRGLNFEATDILRAIYTESAASGDHSFRLDKCLITVGPNGGAAPITYQAPATAVGAVFCYAAVPINLDSQIFSFNANAGVRASLFRMVLVVGDCNHAVNFTQLMPTWQSGDVHDCDHLTWRAPGKAARTRAAVAMLQPNLIAAGSRLTIQNTIAFFEGPALGTGYGAYFGNTTPPGGTMEEHHNGFDGLSLDDCTGPPGNASTDHSGTTCNIAAADPTKDPQFNNAAGTFTWQHTAGAGLNGEGTFAALVVPDLRVNNATYYKNQADDATALQVLDKGALQDYALPVAGSAAGSEAVAAIPEIFCPSVIYDPGGVNEFDLSGRLQLARPLRQERDILLRDYRASDVDLNFIDTDELFLETNPLSFLLDPSTGEPNWYGKKILIQLQLGATELLRFIGSLLEVKATVDGGSMNIGDRFQEIFDRHLLARTVGRIVSTTGQFGLGPALPGGANAPSTGWYLGNVTLLNQDPSTRNRATQCQTWTLTWTADAIPDGTTLAPFFVTGSITGFDGEGQYGVPNSYVSKSGQIAIDTARPGDIREDARAIPVADRTARKNTTTSIRTVWRPPIGTTAVQALELLLTDWRGAGLAADQIDPSIAALSGTVADQLLPAAEFLPTVCRLSFDETVGLLEAIQQMALHLGCTFIEKANGNIGVASFMPRVVEEPDVLCWSDDLVRLDVAHLPIYNLYSVEHAFSESNDKFTQGFSSPDPEDNDSFDRYGRLLPAPGAMRFRGYDASNSPWIEAIARSLYLRYRDPRRIYSVRAKVQRLAADMGDVYRIDSKVPTVGPLFTEPVSISRNITGDLEATLELVEVDSEVVTADCGGYLALDDPLIGLDDECWGLL